MAKKFHARYNKRKKSITRFFIPMLKALVFFAILGLIIWGILNSNPAQFLKTTVHWNIDKTLPIPKIVLKNKIQVFIKDKYQLDLQQIKQALETQAWVQNVHIKRLFWNSIKITIKAHNIAMRWQNADCKNKNCYGYISTKGVLFMPKKLVPSDAVLAISKSDKDTISKLYDDYYHYQKLSKPMLIKSFSKTNIDKLTFTSGVKVILGYQKQHKRLENFIKAYKKLRKKTKKAQNATFDMRYPKGFSVRY